MLREFNDSSGRRWRVWDINPAIHARTSSATVRRQLKVPSGWLCFESGEERRRLSPIPKGWEQSSDGDLEMMCRKANVVADREAHGNRDDDSLPA